MATILVVDDSASMRQMVEFTLKEAGHNVMVAEDGQVALGIAKGAPADLVITDVNMPNMDGITFVKTLKNDAKYASVKFVPVIMLTTESGEDKKQEGRNAGVKAWMTKPFPPESILDAVKKLIA